MFHFFSNESCIHAELRSILILSKGFDHQREMHGGEVSCVVHVGNILQFAYKLYAVDLLSVTIQKVTLMMY